MLEKDAARRPSIADVLDAFPVHLSAQARAVPRHHVPRIGTCSHTRGHVPRIGTTSCSHAVTCHALARVLTRSRDTQLGRAEAAARDRDDDERGDDDGALGEGAFGALMAAAILALPLDIVNVAC